MKKCNDSATEMFIMAKHDLKNSSGNSICSTFNVDAQKP